MTAQGWYVDPFGQHEERWFSADRPTALVRDARRESHDEPPQPTWAGDLETLAEPVTGDDLRRADAATAGAQSVSRKAAALAPVIGSGELGIGFR